MRLLRRLSLLAVTSAFRLTLFFGVSLMAVIILLGKPHQLESSLVKTDTYNLFVPAVIQSINSQTQDKNAIPFGDPGVQKIIKDAFPAKDIQASAETIINSSYSWLNGTTAQLTYKIDFTKNRQILAENLSLYAFNRLAAQPLCTSQPTEVNPFTADCLPRNFSINQEQTQFATEISSLLPKTVFTAADLPALSGGKRINQDFPKIPTYYRIVMLTPWILGGLLILYTTLLLTLSRSPRKGFKLLGSVTLSSGIALVVTPVLYILVYPHINKSLTVQSTNTGVNVLVENVIQNLSHSFYDLLIKASLLIINIGLAIVIIERFSRSRAYDNLSRKVGLATSDGVSPKGLTETTLLATNIPIQTSEQPLSAAARPKISKRWRAYRKLHDKEL